jgi:hypothetical protein
MTATVRPGAAICHSSLGTQNLRVPPLPINTPDPVSPDGLSYCVWRFSSSARQTRSSPVPESRQTTPLSRSQPRSSTNNKPASQAAAARQPCKVFLLHTKSPVCGCRIPYIIESAARPQNTTSPLPRQNFWLWRRTLLFDQSARPLSISIPRARTLPSPR